jgi:hypothetical protein
MTVPKNWQPGDPITAAQLNTGNVEASRPRRAIALGSGSSLVNETLGNQSVSAKVPLIRLVVATEDFAIQETPTDLNGFIDDVPSGLVREVRLNRRSGTHVKDDASKPFRAYDVTAGLTGVFCDMGSDSESASASASASASGSESGPATSGKAFCDVFYVMFNQDSKRWEVMAAGGGNVAPRIRFTVLATDFTVGFGALGCDNIIVLVNHISCGGTGVAVGDEVRVHDPEYCHFNLPVELIVGLSGTATWMKSENYMDGLEAFDIDNCITELRQARCMWMIDTLCCSEEETLNA